jgi:hypothetical protein
MKRSLILNSSVLLALFVMIPVVLPMEAQVRIIDIVPNSRSDETVTDSEPNVAVDPSNPLRIAASALTPNPVSTALTSPIYVSTDGGATWTLNCIVPGNDPIFGTADITLRFGGSSGVLYAAIENGSAISQLNVLRSADFTLTTPMTLLLLRVWEDQPYVQATTVLGGSGVGSDRVYVGSNNVPPIGSLKTAAIDWSLDAATLQAPAGFSASPSIIESRTTSGQDGPPVRTAIHPDGTVYGVFYSWTSAVGDFNKTATVTADVVVVRADGWGTGATPFADLTDPNDQLPGHQVVSGRTVPWDRVFGMGFNRQVGSNLSIAVDPRNSDIVYVAWTDDSGGFGAYGNTLHVRRSSDRGETWSATDLGSGFISVLDVANPALAVNTRGAVGLLYQELDAPFWITHFLESKDDGATWSDTILANFQIPQQYQIDTSMWTTNAPPVFLGDYDHLMAVGKDFYGIFSSDNTPDLANFPSGVTFQRNVDTNTKTLRNFSNTGTVSTSIDPFFFQVTDTVPEDDYYVRDWTDSASSADDGDEPSTHPYFYVTSDVWNQRSSVALPFNTFDQPQNEDARNGLGAAGDNFMLARVHRKAAGPAGTVSLHFLYANFGIGVYQSAGSSILPFFPGSTQGIAGVPWHLDPTTSTHLCLGVEITGPNDAFVPPSLVGSSPGWPTTDLRVLSDNNKAQRNIQILPTGTGAISVSVSGWAILHNAATFPRTMVIRYEVAADTLKRFRNARLQIAGGSIQPLRAEGVLKLENMQPGENRWVRVTLDGPEAKMGETLPVAFFEMAGNVPINGFAIAERPSPMTDVLRYDVELHRSVFTRMASLIESTAAANEGRAAATLLKQHEITEDAYRSFVRQHLSALANAIALVWKRVGWTPIPVGRTSSDIATVAAAHLTALNDLDASLTALQLGGGDPADILQNVRWQQDLFRSLRGSKDILTASRAFMDGYAARKLGNADYPPLIRSLLDSYSRATQGLTTGPDLKRAIADMQSHLDSPAALQKAHRGFLLVLQQAVRRDGNQQAAIH